MDALDSFEDLTELGHHLADLPVEPRLGKMVLYAVVLKCLDPILTIVTKKSNSNNVGLNNKCIGKNSI
jgi:HrpA-like RNA helicase